MCYGMWVYDDAISISLHWKLIAYGIVIVATFFRLNAFLSSTGVTATKYFFGKKDKQFK